jgi:hypothetical protein
MHTSRELVRTDLFWEGRNMTRQWFREKTIAGRIVWFFGALLLAATTAGIQGQTKQPAGEEKAPKLDEKILQAVEDKKPLPVIKRIPGTNRYDGNKDEFDAYCSVVLTASQTSEQAFANSSRENRHLTFGHLFREPDKYRGQVVRVKGTVKRIRKEEAPAPLQKQGIKYLYECWVFSETPNSTPECIIVTELPEGVEVGEDVSYQVTFDGYFFKKYLYVTGSGQGRYTLLLIGRTLQVPATVATTGFMLIWLVVIGSLIAVAILFTFGLGWWFRRGDEQVRARLLQASARRWAEGEEAGGPPIPVTETAKPVRDGNTEANPFEGLG